MWVCNIITKAYVILKFIPLSLSLSLTHSLSLSLSLSLSGL